LILLGVLLLTTSLSMALAPGIFEKLVMPGPLLGARAELEKPCKSCHAPFAQKSQTGLCLACHKPIAADRQAKRNYHGRHPEALASECEPCHTEHKGRTFDIVQLNRGTFNHAFANFTLKGSHKRASCDGCHVKNKKYRETPRRCFDRHRSIDPHTGRWGKSAKAVTARRPGGA
jgi:Class III cytochrome C family